MNKKLKRKLKACGLTIAMLACLGAKAQKSLSSQDYVNLTMDLQGILELKMTTDANVNFDFNTLEKYRDGITKFDATILEVHSTGNWELYVQPASQYWSQQSNYSTGNVQDYMLPSEILEIKSETPNSKSPGKNFNHFIGLTSSAGENIYSRNPNAATQFLEGEAGQDVAGEMTRQKTSSVSGENLYRIHYRIKPGLPASFPNLANQYPHIATSAFSGAGTVQPGFYNLEIIFTLTEDL